jgi:hypothetical protein
VSGGSLALQPIGDWPEIPFMPFPSGFPSLAYPNTVLWLEQPQQMAPIILLSPVYFNWAKRSQLSDINLLCKHALKLHGGFSFNALQMRPGPDCFLVGLGGKISKIPAIFLLAYSLSELAGCLKDGLSAALVEAVDIRRIINVNASGSAGLGVQVRTGALTGTVALGFPMN